MFTKEVMKQRIAVCLSVVLIITGIQIPASASTTGKAGQYHAASPSNAIDEDNEFEIELENDLEDGADSGTRNPGLTASPSDMTEPENIIRPMIIDTTAPVVTRARLLTTEVSYPGHITLELDIVEDGTGIDYISLMNTRGDIIATSGFIQPIFTGTHIVDLDLWGFGFSEGDEFEIGELSVYDEFADVDYELSYEDWPFSEPAVFTITSVESRPPRPDPPQCKLDNIRFLSQEIHVSEYLKAEINMGIISTGVRRIDFTFQNQTNSDRVEASYYRNNSDEIKQGINTIAIDISDLPAGTYDLIGIELNQSYRSTVCYYKDIIEWDNPDSDIKPWIFGDIEITVVGELDPRPEINRINILDTNIKSPGTLDVEMNIIAGNGGVKMIDITLEPKDGEYQYEVITTVLLPQQYGESGETTVSDESVIQTGSYVLHFPIPHDMLPDTDYYITLVEVWDQADQRRYYYDYDEGAKLYELPPIRLTRNNYVVETSVWNPELPSLLTSLPEGSELLLDGGFQGIVPAAIFRAAAGRDITVNIEMDGDPYYLEALYTFNGKEIRAAGARDVNINFSFINAHGQDYGIANENVYLLKLGDRGRLPGSITLRLPTAAFLMAEDSYDRNAMYLSRLSGTSLIREGVVSEAADGFTDIVLTYGADYILSKAEPSYRNSGSSSGGSSGGSSGRGSDTGTWKQDENGWWYQHHNGSYPVSVWEQISGDWYYFEESGYMAAGWKYLNGKWYWMDPGTGKMVANNWVLDRGNWYYLGSDGAMVTGWIIYKDAWYYLSEEPGSTYGRMLSNEDTPDGYQLGQNGMWIR